ncbi:MAG: helix-turn-helix transcriptional regulator [Bdellovibrionaceae bacterium]|nr:helix-turn-helix transcriptional regulator [Pseudobdellovibrionaceae bacterium]
MNPLNQKIGEIIRQKRVAKNMTQLQLSTLLGYESTQFISLFERGLSKVPLNVLGKLSVILEIPAKRFQNLLVADFKNKLQTEMRPR